MSDVGPELNPSAIVKPKEAQPVPLDTWEQIRAMHANAPYSELLQAFLAQSPKWKAEPPVFTDTDKWNAAIRQQISAANNMIGANQNPDFKMEKPGKIFANGVASPPMGQAVMTRLYVGVDPRHSADAFKALIEEMSKNGSMRDVNIAFNEEEVEVGKPVDNTIIIYEPQSRPDVLNKVLSAYKSAKTSNPDAFNLTSRQREMIMRSAFKRFKAVVDANLSFVEMDPEDLGVSWDSNEVHKINPLFGLSEHISGKELKSDSEWVSKIKQHKHGVVLTKASDRALQAGQIKPGDQMVYKRKLSAPALIQRGTLIAK